MSHTMAGSRRNRPLAILGVIAFAVFVLDAASKYWALTNLSGAERPLGDLLRLTLLHNENLAWGLSAGRLTPVVTTLATLGLVALVLRVCRELAAVDRLAPLMLGLIGGGALANGLDVYVGPAGVVDFIAVPVAGQEAVLNVADVAAALGLVLCLRTVFVLSSAIADERSTRVTPAVAAARVHEVPLAVPLFDERPRPAAARQVARLVRVPRRRPADLPADTSAGESSASPE